VISRPYYNITLFSKNNEKSFSSHWQDREALNFLWSSWWCGKKFYIQLGSMSLHSGASPRVRASQQASLHRNISIFLEFYYFSNLTTVQGYTIISNHIPGYRASDTYHLIYQIIVYLCTVVRTCSRFPHKLKLPKSFHNHSLRFYTIIIIKNIF